jgi:tetratricopeptide (TPR) repeat protein
VDELVRRFPRWQAELKMLLACDRMVRPSDVETHSWPSSVKAPAWPEVGSRIGGFLLLETLGRGAMGRTFLASDPDLADRPVVLKLTSRGLVEHVSLARLQHTNVVPLYAAPEFPEHGLRALCMPYLGGTSLDKILQEIRAQGDARPSGRSIVEAADRVQARVPVPIRSEGPSRRLLTSLSYPKAIARIAACLADALGDAHDRGLVHMDVKPANVLIAADGTTMLLDFHLARAPVRPDGPPPTWVGGTPSSMAPEQREAMKAVRQRQPVGVAVDGRADIYGLGRLMHEALDIPGVGEGVTPGLRAIVDRCLDADPRNRFPDAASLAQDLRRHLNDLPLEGVPNRSLVERWVKWRRRSPQSLSRTAVLAFALSGLLALGLQGRRRLDDASEAMKRARQQFHDEHYEEAMYSAGEGLAMIRPWPGVLPLRTSLKEVHDLANQGRAVQRLHALAEQLRLIGEAAPTPSRPSPQRAIPPGLRAAWASYRWLGRRPDVERLPERSRQVVDDLRDLALLGSDLAVRLAADPASKARERREALDLLDEAGSLLGPSKALADARRSHAEALGLTSLAGAAAREAEALSPSTSAEFLSLGLARLMLRDEPGALAAFDRAIEINPHAFWPTFHRGITAYRLGRFDDARADFHACVALAPESAECYYNRALAYAALGQTDRALRDNARALALDPKLADAALNTGLLRYGLGEYAQAEDSLRQALALGADAEVVHYNLALVRLARGDRPGAVEHLRDAPNLPRARTLREQLAKDR